jgi:hypothetical protein
MKTDRTMIDNQPQKTVVTDDSKKRYGMKHPVGTGPGIANVITGLCLGALAGWAIGWRAGAIYKNFSVFEDAKAWETLPVTFAEWGLCIGAVMGIITICLYFHIVLKKLQRVCNDNTNTNFSTFCERRFKMNKTSMIFITLLSMFFLFGCLPSLHPLYTDETVTFDEQLIGKWYDDGGMWSFYKTGDKQYGLNITSDKKGDKPARFDVHLVQLGKYRFIDLYPPKDTIEEMPEMSRFNMVRGHTFMKLDLAEPNLMLQWISFADLIKEDPNVLKHEMLDEDPKILITAEPNELQRVLIENLDKLLAGDKPGQLKRCPAIFSEDNIVYDKQLLGQWQTSSGQYADVMEWDNGGYDILTSDNSNQQQDYKARLFKVDDHLFLGLYTLAPCKQEVESGLHRIPDLVVLIEQIEPQLKVRTIDWKDILETSLSEALNKSMNQSGSEQVYERVAP